jgi:hypothetical protein
MRLVPALERPMRSAASLGGVFAGNGLLSFIERAGSSDSLER